MDSYEYAEAVDIWSSLNKEFWEGLASKKWSERRDALQKLKGLASQPKVQSGDSGDVLRELKKIILKDSNVVCVGEAILCIGSLAKSMRSTFSVRLQHHTLYQLRVKGLLEDCMEICMTSILAIIAPLECIQAPNDQGRLNLKCCSIKEKRYCSAKCFGARQSHALFY